MRNHWLSLSLAILCCVSVTAVAADYAVKPLSAPSETAAPENSGGFKELSIISGTEAVAVPSASAPSLTPPRVSASATAQNTAAPESPSPATAEPHWSAPDTPVQNVDLTAHSASTAGGSSKPDYNALIAAPSVGTVPDFHTPVPTCTPIPAGVLSPGSAYKPGQVTQWVETVSAQPADTSTPTQSPSEPAPCTPTTASRAPAAIEYVSTPQPTASAVLSPSSGNTAPSAGIAEESEPNANWASRNFIMEVVSLVNEQRQEAGLSDLTPDAGLMHAAQYKCDDMVNNSYYAHESPTYGAPIKLYALFNITGFHFWGENIAVGQTSPSQVMEAWMASPEHKANILDADYTRIGVGFTRGGAYKTYWAQEFNG